MIYGMIAKDLVVQVKHFYHKAKFCANYLVNLGINKIEDVYCISYPSHELTHLLYNDLVGMVVSYNCVT